MEGLTYIFLFESFFLQILLKVAANFFEIFELCLYTNTFFFHIYFYWLLEIVEFELFEYICTV